MRCIPPSAHTTSLNISTISTMSSTLFASSAAQQGESAAYVHPHEVYVIHPSSSDQVGSNSPSTTPYYPYSANSDSTEYDSSAPLASVVVQQHPPTKGPLKHPHPKSQFKLWLCYFLAFVASALCLLYILYRYDKLPCALAFVCSVNCPCGVGGECTSDVECVSGLTCPTFINDDGVVSDVGQVCTGITQSTSGNGTAVALPQPDDLIQLIQVSEASNPLVNEAVLEAAAQWNAILTNTFSDIELPSSITNFNELGCSSYPIEDGNTIRGVTVLVSLETIDGENGILGSAASCFHQRNQDKTVQPRIGYLQLDEADLETMLVRGSLMRVLMHEIGHVLGLNKSLWVNKSLTNVDSDLAFTTDMPVPTDYIGEHGDEAYHLIGGLRMNVPLETEGSTGTAGSHFSEDEFDDELMSGYENGRNAISAVTLGSLKDLGYEVDLSKAEEFELNSDERRLDSATPLLPLNEEDDGNVACVMELDGQIKCGGQ